MFDKRVAPRRLSRESLQMRARVRAVLVKNTKKARASNQASCLRTFREPPKASGQRAVFGLGSNVSGFPLFQPRDPCASTNTDPPSGPIQRGRGRELWWTRPDPSLINNNYSTTKVSRLFRCSSSATGRYSAARAAWVFGPWNASTSSIWRRGPALFWRQ